jgi:hypothetical protein
VQIRVQSPLECARAVARATPAYPYFALSPVHQTCFGCTEADVRRRIASVAFDIYDAHPAAEARSGAGARDAAPAPSSPRPPGRASSSKFIGHACGSFETGLRMGVWSALQCARALRGQAERTQLAVAPFFAHSEQTHYCFPCTPQQVRRAARRGAALCGAAAERASGAASRFPRAARAACGSSPSLHG